MNYYVVSADAMLALMILQENGDFLPSDPLTYEYFFLVPETFKADLVESSKNLMKQIYDEHYEVFRINEPNDPNYIAVLNVTPRVLPSDEIRQQPWLAAEMPVWENSNCIVVQSGGGYQKVAPASFGGMLGLDS